MNLKNITDERTDDRTNGRSNERTIEGTNDRTDEPTHGVTWSLHELLIAAKNWQAIIICLIFAIRLPI